MEKSFISVFLFLLFCIVIAFPGYGRGVSVKQHINETSAQIKSTETPKFTLFNVLKKCLSKGISIVEEERPVEEGQNETEDEHSPSVEESLLITQTITVQHPAPLGVDYYHADNFFESVALRGVPEPPPECIL
jgi:hypothetical protein